MIITGPPAEPPAAAPLSASVTVKTTTDEKAKIAADAKKARLSLSAYCRRRILGH